MLLLFLMHQSTVSTDTYQVEGITVDSNSWAYEANFPTYEYSSGGSTLVDIDGGVSFQSQMPNMKVLDFLTSIFKMFNLTAYFVPETDISPFAGQIRVRTLDAYYLSGKEVDISPYVDTASSVVSRNKLYSTVEFEYPDHHFLRSSKSIQYSQSHFLRSSQLPGTIHTFFLLEGSKLSQYHRD